MPHKARRPCKHQGCPALVPPGQGYCTDHQPPPPQRRNPDNQRMYNNNRWKRYRVMFLAEHPLCVNHAECHNAANVVDHIVDHDGDWAIFWDRDNHQPMCTPCHNRKTAQTRGWGKQHDKRTI